MNENIKIKYLLPTIANLESKFENKIAVALPIPDDAPFY